MKKPSKRTPQSKLSGEGLAAFEALQARLKDLPNPLNAAGQARLLDAGLADLSALIPEVVLQLLAQAAPISVADATLRARTAGKSWQDVKATLELQVKLVRARALWEHGDTKAAGLELVQVSASASSRRAELILTAAQRDQQRLAWSPTFSLALLRSASGALTNSLPAALALVDAMTGAGEQAPAALVLGQVIAARALWPELDRSTLEDRIARLGSEHQAALRAALP